ncbi:unnamed protein product, partial [Prorocentrum cordatum]
RRRPTTTREDWTVRTSCGEALQELRRHRRLDGHLVHCCVQGSYEVVGLPEEPPAALDEGGRVNNRRGHRRLGVACASGASARLRRLCPDLVLGGVSSFQTRMWRLPSPSKTSSANSRARRGARRGAARSGAAGAPARPIFEGPPGPLGRAQVIIMEAA